MTSYRPVVIVAAPAVVLVILALNATTDAMYVGGLVLGASILGAAGAMAHEVWQLRRWRRRAWGPPTTLTDLELDNLRRRRR